MSTRLDVQNELLSTLQRGGKVRSLIKQYGSAPILLMQTNGLIEVDAGEIKLTPEGLRRILTMSQKAAEDKREEARAQMLISGDGRKKRILDLEE